jgi:ACT domain-containing protein
LIILEALLKDQPGSLIEFLKPISENGGNIFGIIHDHNKKKNNLIPVHVTFELHEELLKTNLSKIREALEKKGIKISKLTRELAQQEMKVILWGHVFESDIVNTVKRIAEKGARVSEIRAKLLEVKDESSALLTIELPVSIDKKTILDTIQQICKEKNLLLFKSE